MSDIRLNIWRLQAQFNINGLIEALQNEDAGIRKRAAAALRTLGAVEAVPALTKALEVENEPDTRSNIAAALDHLVPEKVEKIPSLIAQLKSNQIETVIQAARQLGDLKDKTSVEALVLIFHNTHLPGRVRLVAAQALIKLESAPAVVTLLAALGAKDWNIRRNAAAVLGQLRADWAVEPIVERLTDENEVVRRTARAALKRIGTAEALKAMESISAEKTNPVQPKAQTARLSATEPFKPRPLIIPSTDATETEPVTPASDPATPTSHDSLADKPGSDTGTAIRL